MGSAKRQKFYIGFCEEFGQESRKPLFLKNVRFVGVLHMHEVLGSSPNETTIMQDFDV